VRNEKLSQERQVSSRVLNVETQIREVTDRVWVRDGSFELDRQGLQDERYTLSLDHSLSLFGSSHLIPQRHHPFYSRLWVENACQHRNEAGITYTHTLEVSGWVIQNKTCTRPRCGRLTHRSERCSHV
jgi:hypothetical protein